MKINNKLFLWSVCSLAFLASVNAKAAFGDNDTTEAKSDTSAVKIDSVEAVNPASIIDEVIWVVGDEAILKSDVEATRLQAEAEGVKWSGDPDCTIPEQLAVQKLFLHQAELDSIEVTEAEVAQNVENQINYWIQIIGSKEKLEEYKRASLTELRQQMHDDFRNRQLIEREKEELVKDITVSPSDVRKYFNSLPADSIPEVPTEVEVQIITLTPKVEQAEIDRVKDQLRSFTDRVTNGETSFAALARLYSEDPGSARQGGELGDYVGRGVLDPAFANVAFNLTSPDKISKIVESEYGFHIIQLIDKRGDRIKVRHILMKPRVSAEAITKATSQLDSVADIIRSGRFTFDQTATMISDDKDTRSNNGLMANSSETGRTSKFRMRDLPSEIAKVVDTLKVGDISSAFQMINNKGKTVCAIVKLKSRVDAHRATITEDFQTMKDIVLVKRKEEFINEWISNKIKSTYVKINDRYKNCDFEYQGWIR
ncbi:MAG: peptidylprolyl isomerase [Prevotellaceae bacterium]|nr:peptidylprolyl isomerase [Prevotellaceae bacterium]